MTNDPSRSPRSAGLSAAAAALGITAALSQAVTGASLNTNLVVNGDFEAVTSTTAVGAYFSGWTSGTAAAPSASTPFGYNYAQGYDERAGNFVPPGNSPTSTTDYYWSMNGFDLATFQTIGLGTGATASVIATGAASYDIRAYFTTYLNDLESGRMTLEFLDAANAVLGAPIHFDDPERTQWTLVGGTGAIPVNTTQARITLLRNPASGLSTGPDIYADNIAFSVIPEPSGAALGLLGGGLLAWRRNRSRPSA